MHFSILRYGSELPHTASGQAFLLADNWDDYFSFATSFVLFVPQDNGIISRIGAVKIGQLNMVEKQYRPSVPDEFISFSNEFFSLGQDESYYEELKKLSPETREEILGSLRDISFDLNIYESVKYLDITHVSLMRYVTDTMIRGQFHRMAHGGAMLTPYAFAMPVDAERFTAPNAQGLTFSVHPNSLPPTNVHVLIGSNGVGKTTLLQKIAKYFIETEPAQSIENIFSPSEALNTFANIVYISFSAFDDPPVLDTTETSTPFNIIKLSDIARQSQTTSTAGLSHTLADGFGQNIRDIFSNPSHLGRWKKAVDVLSSDELLGLLELTSFGINVPADRTAENVGNRAARLFHRLSSGHKIVLLTIAHLIMAVEERSLVLLDEPESHLHPPLLSAFVRALSNLLIDRNGVSVIATHSPVILQEVPKSCVWKMEAFGGQAYASRPAIETFGENVSILANEIFGLEVTYSGFHNMLSHVVHETTSYEEAYAKFEGHLGSEAKAILRAMFANRNLNA